MPAPSHCSPLALFQLAEAKADVEAAMLSRMRDEQEAMENEYYAAVAELNKAHEEQARRDAAQCGDCASCGECGLASGAQGAEAADTASAHRRAGG